MKVRLLILTAAAWSIGSTGPAQEATKAASPPAFPNFKVQEIAADLKIGYAVVLSDVNGDRKPDLVVVDQLRVVWYENPTWKMRTILQGKTKPDNVCIAPLDITGDGLPEFVLGAGWKPFDTATPGTLQWLKRGATLDDEWTMYPIANDEPVIHRIRTADINGDGKPELISAPLMGRGSSAKANWMDGRPVRITAYAVPNQPEQAENWKPTLLSDELHVVHNIWPTSDRAILATAYEGVFQITRDDDKWTTSKIGSGNQETPAKSRGASEIKLGSLGKGRPVVATIEPWHGNQVVVYTPPSKPGSLWSRHVIDTQLRWGHAVSFADLDGDGADELVIGVRDDPSAKAGDTHTQRRGVRVYRCTDGIGAKWDRQIIENGGVAVEDLTVGDLNGDGKPDIVAVGRATGNARIYWNQGK